MRLYYYTSQHYGLAAIRDKRLKIAKYTELNDPFDFIGVATGSLKDRNVLKRLRERISEKEGILCMCRTWVDPLMWGHYAEKHKGICLAFEVDTKDWTRVDYVEERPKLSDYNKTTVSRLSDDDISDIAIKKFKKWEYEKEYRRFIPLEKPDYVDGHYFANFDSSMVLKGVMFGERTTVQLDQLKAILEENRGLKAMYTRAAFKSFTVVEAARKNVALKRMGRMYEPPATINLKKLREKK
ncbi:DUF2971 domain-containing protein [Agrobacterium tumefaciens]|nr:DUF2971 domain-containing protein [Agrobacterium tumefaciens]